jgi:hypothetical protein
MEGRVHKIKSSSCPDLPFINTGLQPGVWPTEMNISRFNGFANFLKAAEAAEFSMLRNTGLKPGANEMRGS